MPPKNLIELFHLTQASNYWQTQPERSTVTEIYFDGVPDYIDNKCLSRQFLNTFKRGPKRTYGVKLNVINGTGVFYFDQPVYEDAAKKRCEQAINACYRAHGYVPGEYAIQTAQDNLYNSISLSTGLPKRKPPEHG